MGPIQLIICSLAYQAWAEYLTGNSDSANIIFRQAEELMQKINPRNSAIKIKTSHLCDLWGIYYADFLRKTGSLKLAKLVTKENLRYAKLKNLEEIKSQCFRVLGDLCIEEENQHPLKEARRCYQEALRIARNLSHRAVLIEALLARGRWAAISNDYVLAKEDLAESLSLVGSYRVYEVDIYVGFALAHQTAGY